MQKLSHPIISGILSVAFVVAVQIFATPQPVFRFLLPAFTLYLVVVAIYNYFYLKSRGVYNFWLVVRPLLLIAGWFGTFFIIPNTLWRGLYLLIGVAVIYFVERTLGNPGEQLLFNETVLTAFTGLMAITALSHYFIFSGAFYLFVIFAVTTIIARASYEMTPHSARMKWIVAVVLGLGLAEVFWSSSFLPLHYSAIGLLLFNVFYCTWTLCYYFLYNHLTPKKIQFHVVMAVLFTAIILVVTPWRILQ